MKTRSLEKDAGHEREFEDLGRGNAMEELCFFGFGFGNPNTQFVFLCVRFFISEMFRL